MTTIRTALLAAAAAGIAFVAQPAFADQGAPSIEVSYAGIDLTTPAGQKQLQARVTRAARKVCTRDGDSRDLAVISAQRNCMHIALASANQQVAMRVNEAGQRNTDFAMATAPKVVGH